VPTLTQEHRPRLWTVDFGLGLLLCFGFCIAFNASWLKGGRRHGAA